MLWMPNPALRSGLSSLADASTAHRRLPTVWQCSVPQMDAFIASGPRTVRWFGVFRPLGQTGVW
jgi:hypothetical protein